MNEILTIKGDGQDLLQQIKKAGSLYPLSEYRPFYYTSYGDSLQQTGRLK